MGFLYQYPRDALPPLIFGGEQEHGLRAGPENVAGMVATGYALKESVECMHDVSHRLQSLIQETLDIVRKHISHVCVNGDSEYRLPGVLNLGFDCVFGEALMNLLDLKGICVSTSSVCNSGKCESFLQAICFTNKSLTHCQYCCATGMKLLCYFMLIRRFALTFIYAQQYVNFSFSFAHTPMSIIISLF